MIRWLGGGRGLRHQTGGFIATHQPGRFWKSGKVKRTASVTKGQRAREGLAHPLPLEGVAGRCCPAGNDGRQGLVVWQARTISRRFTILAFFHVINEHDRDTEVELVPAARLLATVVT